MGQIQGGNGLGFVTEDLTGVLACTSVLTPHEQVL